MNVAHPLLQNLGSELDTWFEGVPHNTLWVTLPESGKGEVPYFSPAVLAGLMSVLRCVQSNGVAWPMNGATQPVHYVVLKSGHPHYFSLGGDLRHFSECIRRRDRDALSGYSRLCADMIHEWSTALGNHTTNIALIQGRALGGGFETALAADVIVAEEQSEFGFPETMFGLFPCSGGMSLLAQRIGPRAAERMLADSRIYSAEELHRLGIIDVVCPQGQGESAVRDYVARHSRHRSARLMLQRGRHRLAALDRAELHRVVEEWADLAMQLTAVDLRVMEMLAKMQRGRVAA